MSSIPQDSAIEQISRSETDHSRSFWKALYRNAFSSIAGTVLSLVIGLFAFPFTVHRLGATSYGVWMLALSIVGYLGLLDIGLGPTLIKKTAEHVAHGRSETAALCRTVSTVCFIYTAMGILAGAAILVIGVAGEQWFKVGADLVPTFRIVVWLVGLQTAVGFPLSVGAGIVAGLQEFHILNGVNITANLLRTTLTIGLLLAGYGLISLVVSAFVISVANWLFTWAWAKKRIPELRLDIRSVNRSSVSEVASFSWAMLLWSVAGYALHQADRVIIGIYLPVASITTYEVGSRVNQYSRNLLQSWLDNIMPAAASLHTQHDHENIRALYFKSTRYLLLGYVSLASALACFGHTFLTLWVGPQFGESAAIMMFLVGASLFQAQTVVGHVILAATGRLRIFCTLMGLYSVVSVLMGVIFVIQWGLVGAAAAIAATVVLLESIFVLRIFKSFGITTAAVLRECHLPCLKFVIGPIVLGIILRQEIDIRSWPILLGALSLYGWALSCSLWIFGLTADERRDITTYAAGLLKPKPQSVGQ